MVEGEGLEHRLTTPMSAEALWQQVNEDMLIWTPPYGAPNSDRIFVMDEHHGPWVEGMYNGNRVKLLDLVQGILCRIVSPTTKELLDAEKPFHDGRKARHVSQTSLNEDVASFPNLVRRLLSNSGLGDYRILLSTTGSTANDMAMRLAVAYTNGGIPFYFKWAYHGANAAQNSVCGAPGWLTPELGKLFRNFERLQEAGSVSHVEHTIDAVEQQLRIYKKLGVRPIIFAEDVQGVGGGFLQIPNEVMSAAAEMIHAQDGVFVNDNVQTWVRRGTLWAADDWMTKKGDPNQSPDIITLGKAIANGHTVAVVAVKKHIADDLYARKTNYGIHWDTFAHNAMYLSVAHALWTYLIKNNFPQNLRQESDYIRQHLEDIRRAYPDVLLGVQGVGGLIGLVLPSKKHTTVALEYAPECGIYVGRGGPNGEVIRVALLADSGRKVRDLTLTGIDKLMHTVKREAV